MANKPAKHPQHHRLSPTYRWLVTIGIIGLLGIVLVPQADALYDSLQILRHVTWLPVAIAVVMTALTYLLSAEIYHALLKHPISFRAVALVQTATALTSRVAPIGVGTMGLNALFFRRRGHTTAESLAVVAANNGLGVVGHFLLLAIIATTAPWPGRTHLNLSWSMLYWAAFIIVVSGLTLAFVPRVRRFALAGVKSLLRAVAGYRDRRSTLALMLVMSMLLSVVYVLALVAAAQAVGISLPFNQIFLIYSFSLLTGVATPTPGGLVGVEAGLYGGFVAYGVAAEPALAAALLYRLVTYWLPLLPGFIAFRIVQHRYF